MNKSPARCSCCAVAAVSQGMMSGTLWRVGMDECPRSARRRRWPSIFGLGNLFWITCAGSPVLSYMSWITCPVSLILGHLVLGPFYVGATDGFDESVSARLRGTKTTQVMTQNLKGTASARGRTAQGVSIPRRAINFLRCRFRIVRGCAAQSLRLLICSCFRFFFHQLTSVVHSYLHGFRRQLLS